nr:MAG: capsid protein [Grus japonensis parvo-like hybrid virus]
MLCVARSVSSEFAARMARGFVPRGYDYLGPGNDNNRGPPRNEADVLAQDHDSAYTALLEAGGRPYTQWSEADKRFFENLTVNDIPTAVAKGLFGLKKGLHASGLIDATDSQSNLRGGAQMAGGRLRGQTRFNDDTREEAMRASRDRGRQGREQEGGTGRRFRTEGTDLEGALIAVGNDPGNDSLLDLPGTQDEGQLGSQTTLDDMEIGDRGVDPQDNQLALAARSGGDGGMGSVSKETPISIPPSITYGLQETHTTILPWNCWLSAAGMDYGVPVQLPIRMNGVNDMLPLTTGPAITVGSTLTPKGIFSYKSSSLGARSFLSFPAELAPASTAITEKPSWRDYWFAIYEYYTVLKCHYEIIIENPMQIASSTNASVLIGTQFDSYSDVATPTGNVMPLTSLVQSMAFEHMKWDKVDGQQTSEQQKTDNNRTVISGTYMPGMIKRNIQNDGDVKTWTKTDNSIPTLKDILTVNFWSHPMATATGATPFCVNIQMNIKYVVQFKDLKLQARYPNSISAAGFDIIQELSNNIATGDAYPNPIA